MIKRIKEKSVEELSVDVRIVRRVIWRGANQGVNGWWIDNSQELQDGLRYGESTRETFSKTSKRVEFEWGERCDLKKH